MFWLLFCGSCYTVKKKTLSLRGRINCLGISFGIFTEGSQVSAFHCWWHQLWSKHGQVEKSTVCTSVFYTKTHFLVWFEHFRETYWRVLIQGWVCICHIYQNSSMGPFNFAHVLMFDWMWSSVCVEEIPQTKRMFLWSYNCCLFKAEVALETKKHFLVKANLSDVKLSLGHKNALKYKLSALIYF